MKGQHIWLGLAFIFIGILVLVFPNLLFWFVGIGSIVVGILQLIGRR